MRNAQQKLERSQKTRVQILQEAAEGECIDGCHGQWLACAREVLQYVAQYPDGTSIRTLETKTEFLRRPFQFSVNGVFRMKAEHFSFKIKVLTI